MPKPLVLTSYISAKIRWHDALLRFVQASQRRHGKGQDPASIGSRPFGPITRLGVLLASGYEGWLLADSNGPSTYQAFMTNLMGHLPFVTIYIDDICVHSQDEENHWIHVGTVLDILAKASLKINLKKCRFNQRRIKYLGYYVSADGIEADEEKIAAIKNWKAPRNPQELQRFLGFYNFYHRFFENMAKLAGPLYRLLRKDADWVWDNQNQEAFDKLKQRLMELPMLAFPDPNLPYDLHVDSSSYSMEAILCQHHRPVAYASKTLSPAEQNYSVTEKECLAVVWALVYFHCY